MSQSRNIFQELTHGYLTNRIEEFVNLLPKDKSITILVYCRSGHMSQIAASRLAEMGYKNIYELDGGVLAWQREGLPY
jgi:rhodanese-related sulfurtransferase